MDQRVRVSPSATMLRGNDEGRGDGVTVSMQSGLNLNLQFLPWVLHTHLFKDFLINILPLYWSGKLHTLACSFPKPKSPRLLVMGTHEEIGLRHSMQQCIDTTGSRLQSMSVHIRTTRRTGGRGNVHVALIDETLDLDVEDGQQDYGDIEDELMTRRQKDGQKAEDAEETETSRRRKSARLLTSLSQKESERSRRLRAEIAPLYERYSQRKETILHLCKKKK
ncbi:hypothetical protein ANN_09774 [Periplaneta americana]|uniref:Uncharacterized protein n=1 Tax=Periplaneta americana TaxID=6978 RepID=A0ABQ8TPA9_PERAM|nr:hypothetical protein ANN_09774 [Periplaneta americana]